MKKFKKGLRLFLYTILIVFASIGIGINSAIMPTFRKRNTDEVTIELVESKDDESEESSDKT